MQSSKTLSRTDAVITRGLIDKAMSYTEFRKLMMKLTDEGRTTGSDQNESLQEETVLNWKRMQEIEKAASLEPDTIDLLQSFRRPVYMLALAEAWCRDVAESFPILGMITDASPVIEFGILLRDEHPELMDAYLTKGERAIPKVIFLNKEDMKELAVWGPRPSLLQKLVEGNAGERSVKPEEMVRVTAEWYLADKGKTIEQEIVAILKGIGEGE